MYKCFLCCKPTDKVYEHWNNDHTASMFICESCKDSLKKGKNNEQKQRKWR